MEIFPSLKARVRALGLLLTAICATGCGTRPATVHGKVLYKDDQVPHGEIHFVGEHASRSGIIAAGTYTIENCPHGKVKVHIVAEKLEFAPPTFKIERPEIVPPDAKQPPPKKTSLIPLKYSKGETSGLSFDIKPGIQTIDIELKD